MKLDYLQELGVTSILLTPLYESFYYHNYYSSDFSSIDPTYGTEEEFIELVREIHRRDMKIYMDMETQYVTEDHLWYKDSYGNPSSPYSEYILYDDEERSEEHTSELQSLMRISYARFCLKTKQKNNTR